MKARGKRIPWDGTGLCEHCGKELRTTAFRTIDGGTYCSRKCGAEAIELEMREIEDDYATFGLENPAVTFEREVRDMGDLSEDDDRRS